MAEVWTWRGWMSKIKKAVWQYDNDNIKQWLLAREEWPQAEMMYHPTISAENNLNDGKTNGVMALNISQ